jgi:hypothetical protein
MMALTTFTAFWFLDPQQAVVVPELSYILMSCTALAVCMAFANTCGGRQLILRPQCSL